MHLERVVAPTFSRPMRPSYYQLTKGFNRHGLFEKITCMKQHFTEARMRVDKCKGTLE